ncbi:hypothetical protein ADL15_40325 [Actinoplanes awajinensis subsp. mycoplanecinus]|uniref:Contractile injection system tube protein N-terminal domain-containing protein n=2 Tax=Actinoplanes awajinensis TaxID=135946 RepID=A0A101JEW8_9ACTN|nr:hypothetical protein ADL15_40325 [Actinoplanes awajinensis subsp. mycoplanecinus]
MSIDMLPPLVVRFDYNPESLRDDKAVSYTDAHPGAGIRAPGKVYVGGGDRTITFTLHLHGLEKGHNRTVPGPTDNGVSTDLAVLRSFLYPREDAWAVAARRSPGQSIGEPPLCLFGFGTRLLHCWVTGLQITEQQFNSRLAPVRAEVVVTLIVVEEATDALHRLDVQHREALAALGAAGLPPW